MDFPTIVYRCPGPHFGPPGATYESVGVIDQKTFDSFIADGWHKNLVDAVFAYLNEDHHYDDDNDDDELQSVTREEMLQQAQKIGLKIDKRWSDATLLQKINDFMQ